MSEINKSEIAISVKDLHKTFKLPHEQHSGIKQLLVNRLKGAKGYENQHVLKNINFEIKKGEFFGIVGRNGSGKSTLLKILAGIYTPDKGGVDINGSLTPFIELGVGFNPELTGRENVFLNGALLGFSRKEVESMYDSIVEFAELEKFMDQKLKNYSSGMQVRLAFSVAIRANSDILILDEVLAVGDAAFQAKCYDYFEELKRNKKTVVLVTHDMSAVERFCNRAILLSEGSLLVDGRPSIVAAKYTIHNYKSTVKDIYKKNNDKEGVVKFSIVNNKTILKYGEDIKINLDWKNLKNVKNVGVAIYKNTGEYIYGTNTIIDKVDLTNEEKITYNLKLNIGNGNYHFRFGFFGNTDQEIIQFVENGPTFSINDHTIAWGGLTELDHQWVTRNV